MKIKRYKQYFWHDDKVISALKEFVPEDYDDPFCGDHFYDRNNYRPMRIKVLDSKGNPCTSLEKMSFTICNDYPEDIIVAQNFAQAVFGELDGWTPATVNVLSHSLFVYIVRFPDRKTSVDFESIMIHDIPNDIRFQIDIDAAEGFEAERYMLYSVPDSQNDKTEFHFIVQEYKNNVLKRTCELGRDKEGSFELITEAE